IHARPSLNDRLRIRLQNEVAGRVQKHAAHAGKADANFVWIRSRLNDEIVLELTPIAVILDINARVDLRIPDLLIGADVCSVWETVTPEIVGWAGKYLQAFHLSILPSTRKLHLDHGSFGRRESHDGFIAG